jgi:hypothetical protein
MSYYPSEFGSTNEDGCIVNEFTFLSCFKCHESIQASESGTFYTCPTVGCSYVAHADCVVKHSRACTLCRHATKPINNWTYRDVDESVIAVEKPDDFKTWSNDLLVLATNMLADDELSERLSALVLDGDQSNSRLALMEAFENLDCDVCNANCDSFHHIKTSIMTEVQNEVFPNQLARVFPTKIGHFMLNNNGNQKYNLIYLDGCGTWAGNQEYGIQEDIHRSVKCLKDTECILAVTFSLRGVSANMGMSSIFQNWIIWLISRQGRSVHKTLLDRKYNRNMAFLMFRIAAKKKPQLTHFHMETWKQKQQNAFSRVTNTNSLTAASLNAASLTAAAASLTASATEVATAASVVAAAAASVVAAAAVVKRGRGRPRKKIRV